MSAKMGNPGFTIILHEDKFRKHLDMSITLR